MTADILFVSDTSRVFSDSALSDVECCFRFLNLKILFVHMCLLQKFEKC